MPVEKKIKAGRPRVHADIQSVYDTMEQCSSATGIPVDILRQSKKEGCPAFRHNRINIVEFLDWFFNKPAIEGDEEEDKTDWKKRNERAAALIRENQLQEAYGRVIDFALAEGFIDYIIRTLFFGELERIRQEFPGSLKGKTEIDIQVEVSRQVGIIKKNLEGSFAIWRDTKGKKNK